MNAVYIGWRRQVRKKKKSETVLEPSKIISSNVISATADIEPEPFDSLYVDPPPRSAILDPPSV